MVRKSTKLFYAMLLGFSVSTWQAQAQNSSRLPCGGYGDFEIFYAQATDSLLTNFSYGYVSSDRMVVNQDEYFRNYFFIIKPSYQWGFRAAVGYDFPSCDPCANYGVSLEYTHFRQKNSDKTPRFNATGEDERQIVPLALIDSPRGILYSEGNADFETKYSTFDALAHKNILLNNCSNVQLFAGIRYLYLRENYDAGYGINPIPSQGSNPILAEAHFENRFDGVGPTVGTNVFYSLCGGFGISGQLAGSLLGGQSNSEYQSHLFADFGVPDAFYDTVNTHPNSTLIVPGVGAKLALAFKAKLCNGGDVGIELGYRGDKYFGVLNQSALVESLEVPDGTLAVGGNQKFNKDATYHDFSFKGPYLNVSVHI